MFMHLQILLTKKEKAIMVIISKIIFDFDAWLDSHGVNEWNLRTVAVTVSGQTGRLLLK
jgi:hypothetical protein